MGSSGKKEHPSSPQGMILEIAEQVKQIQEDPIRDWGNWNRKTFRRRHYDPHRAALATMTRMRDCGTFPRGKVVIEFKDGETKSLGAHQCNARTCPRCGSIRGRKLHADMEAAIGRMVDWGFGMHRVRLCTFTIPNTDTAWEGFEAISAAWHRFLANRRVRLLIAGGFRAFEAKAGRDGKWNVHLHALVWTWGQGVPYADLRRAWNRAAGIPVTEEREFNQRFDELRKRAKAKQGETKASAAARYMTKYLVKLEDLEATRNAPGGLPHLIASMEGRRLFSAFGVATVARRWNRVEKPDWLGSYQRHLDGWRSKAGYRPVRAWMDAPGWSGPVAVPVPMLPGCLDAADVPEQVEKAPERIRALSGPSPLAVYDWKAIPIHNAELGKWMGWSETRRRARSRIRNEATSIRAFRKAWKAWREQHATMERAPKPMVWGVYWDGLGNEWARDVGVILGERRPCTLGGALWSRINPTRDPDPEPSDRGHWSQAIVHGIAIARKTLLERLVNTPRADRYDMLRSFPAHLSRRFIEGGGYGPRNWERQPDGSWAVRILDADDRG